MYVEEAIPRRTQPSGKRGHLEIKNLAAADQKHNLDMIAFFQRPLGIPFSRDKSLIVDHHLDGHIQLALLVQQYFSGFLAVPVHNMCDDVRHGPIGHIQMGLFPD